VNSQYGFGAPCPNRRRTMPPAVSLFTARLLKLGEKCPRVPMGGPDSRQPLNNEFGSFWQGRATGVKDAPVSRCFSASNATARRSIVRVFPRTRCLLGVRANPPPKPQSTARLRRRNHAAFFFLTCRSGALLARESRTAPAGCTASPASSCCPRSVLRPAGWAAAGQTAMSVNQLTPLPSVTPITASRSKSAEAETRG